ncbi:MAG TPA: MerR family transcriptional regulator [Solibacterales bacterium]|nr:MerR family transcriptional regulator [Bryobacterales bacterium]
MGGAALQSDRPEIPDKLYFRIGEVSRLLGVEPYVLRYWESEFKSLNPKKSGTGHRLYRRKDVELLLTIKELLYAKRYTIEGARQALQVKATPKSPETQAPLFTTFYKDDPLIEVRRELTAILHLLQSAHKSG